METLALKQIIPDENQPRKYFAANKMAALKESIKKHGIMSPLVVSKMGTQGKYLLVDGERRYRAASDLKLSTVPVIVEPEMSDTERMIRQFNVQEQHEAWTPIEKAQSIIILAKEMGASLVETCKMLGVKDNRTISRYVAFAELTNKEEYVRNEIPLDFVVHFKGLTNLVRSLSLTQLEQDFSRQDEKKFQSRLVKLISEGIIINRKEFTQLKDAFTKNPKMIAKFMTTNATPNALFIESKAKGANALRNLTMNASYVSTHGRRFLDVRDVKISKDQLDVFKTARAVLSQVIDLVE